MERQQPDSVSSNPERAPKVIPIQNRRAKHAKRSVLVMDRMADRTIKIGGILVIVAVFGILVFLFKEVLPLFQGGKLVSKSSFTVTGLPAGPLTVVLDEYRTIVVAMGADGGLVAFHAGTGKPIRVPAFDFGGKRVTAVASTLERDALAFGFEDGTVRFGKISQRTEVQPEDRRPDALTMLDARDATDGSSVYSVIPGHQIRRVWVETTLEAETQASSSGSPIVALDYRVSGVAERMTRAVVVLDATGEVSMSIGQSKLNLLTRQITTTFDKAVLPALPADAEIRQVLMTQKGDRVYCADAKGRIIRYNTQDLSQPMLAEIVSVTGPGVQVSSIGFLAGEQSVVVGGSDGSLAIYFCLARENARAQDGFALVRAREFTRQKAPIMALETSRRGKTFAAADVSGGITVRNGTSQETLLSLQGGNSGYRGLALTPRLDGLFGIQEDGAATLWRLDIPHPETSLRTLFGKVWYEGYPEPTYTWQSSAASDEFEPKLSLVPLIFGTIKATVYSLLFAIPIALLGAIYTSEFLHRKVRAMVKPIMEMMASLPSVVLGFVAALVLAPIVETWIAAVILAFVVMPLCLVLSAYAWQFLPSRISIRLQGIPKLVLVFATTAGGIYLAYLLGPAFERLFFDGSFLLWVNGTGGSATPMLFLILLPVSLVAATVLGNRIYGNRFKGLVRRASHLRAAALSLGHWAAVGVVSVIAAFGVAKLLTALGMDARGAVVGTYVQRNTLVVGFAMGFAVIPIIYTLAEDALNSVPEHLRGASLGCGATPWQTAIWVVLPTAVSGVFSAIMIGMGRAVGETMIVVMATGNTGIIDWNIFNGLRALSANIAVELPEAVKDGTLYRVLFLTGLILFAMTFAINTLAEIIRQRFRKRASSL
ncbi:MAG: ABC transporter permease subunit [Syntrophobacteraceae bacterium]